jgi:hypothetical protein
LWPPTKSLPFGNHPIDIRINAPLPGNKPQRRLRFVKVPNPYERLGQEFPQAFRDFVEQCRSFSYTEPERRNGHDLRKLNKIV